MSNDQDDAIDVVARLRRLDPRRHARYEVVDADARMARIVSTRRAAARGARTRRRWTIASVGAVVVAGAVVAALLAAAAPVAPGTPRGTPRTRSALPVLRLRSGLTSMGDGALNVGEAEPGASTYVFTASPTLSTATGSSTAYRFASPSDVAAATATVASALGLAGGVTYLGPENYNGGPSPGPDVTVDVVAGIVNWLYPTWSGNVHTDPGLGNPSTCCSISVNPGASLPTDDAATTAARALLVASGLSATQLGTAQVSRYQAAVDVSFPVSVGGLTTDQSAQVSYGPGPTVLTASGIVATATPSATYPTIAPSQAVGLLTASSGDTEAPAPTDVVDVDVTTATLTLATYELVDGSTWLLPTWVLSGPEQGSGVRAGSTFTGDVLAVSSQYVQPIAP